MISLQKLKYVVTVAHYGSFHKAAQALYISQPSLSAAIQEVEAELQIKLFTRSNRGTQLTLAGIEFLPYAHQTLQAASFIENLYQRERANSGRLTVVCHHNANAASALIRLAKLVDLPSWYIHYNEKTTVDILSDIAGGKADIGFVCVNKLGIDVLKKRIRRYGLEISQLVEASPYIIVRKEHPLTECKEIMFSFEHGELEKYPFVAFDQGTEGVIEFAEEFVDLLNPSSAEQAIYVNDRSAKLDILLRSDAYTSGVPFYDSFFEPYLTCIPITNSDSMVWHCIRNPTRRVSSLEQVFTNFFMDELSVYYNR